MPNKNPYISFHSFVFCFTQMSAAYTVTYISKKNTRSSSSNTNTDRMKVTRPKNDESQTFECIARASSYELFFGGGAMQNAQHLHTHTCKQRKEWKKKSKTQHGHFKILYMCVRVRSPFTKNKIVNWRGGGAEAWLCNARSAVSFFVKKEISTEIKHNPFVVWLSCRYCCRLPLLTPCQHFVAFQFSNSVSVRYYSSLCKCTNAHVQTPYYHPK